MLSSLFKASAVELSRAYEAGWWAGLSVGTLVGLGVCVLLAVSAWLVLRKE